MGADIHGFWEVYDHTGNWIAVDVINSQRNYMWFGIIAGVRGGPSIGTDHRGIPPDASGAYRDLVDEWKDDLHSHTWLSIKEVEEACVELNRRMVEAYNSPSEVPYEFIPTEDMNITQLIVTWGSNIAEPGINWCGTLKELMSKAGDINSNVRMVLCFDS